MSNTPNMGFAVTARTNGHGIYGLKGRIILPKTYCAFGYDGQNYFDAYFGFFDTSPKDALFECGLGYYGEKHDGGSGKAPFPRQFSAFVNPTKEGYQQTDWDSWKNAHAQWRIPERAPAALYKGQHNELVANMHDQAANFEIDILDSEHADCLVDDRFFHGSNRFRFRLLGHENTNEASVLQSLHDKGYNVKICIGYYSLDHTVAYSDFKICLDSILCQAPRQSKPSWTDNISLSNLEGELPEGQASGSKNSIVSSCETRLIAHNDLPIWPHRQQPPTASHLTTPQSVGTQTHRLVGPVG
jgi:hypothetical protein